jgi:hypothetical protein
MTTTTAGVIGTPTVTGCPDGWTVNASRDGEAGKTSNGTLTADVKPDALATSV